MATIRHIALVVDNAEETAAFYTLAFGLKEVFRQKNDETRGQWAILRWMTLMPHYKPRSAPAPFLRIASILATDVRQKRSCAIRCSASSWIFPVVG
jgi:catechol 2,3-dioxygenase-like lactoylglutathione lyase family enzyme